MSEHIRIVMETNHVTSTTGISAKEQEIRIDITDKLTSLIEKWDMVKNPSTKRMVEELKEIMEQQDR